MSVRLLSIGVVLVCGTAFGAADEKTTVQRGPIAVRNLIKQLASKSFATREKATRELSKLDKVPAALREATKSNDPELRARAQIVVDAITRRAKAKVFKAFVKWTVTKDFESNDPHDPLVVHDKVIVGTDRGQLRAYRCEDGSPVWVHQHGARIFYSPCSDGERIYFSSAKGLTAVKVEDGSKVWEFGGAECDGPAVVLPRQGKVVVGGSDGILYALDAKTGKKLWASDFVADAPPDPPGFPGKRARGMNRKARPSALASDGATLFLSVFDQSRLVAVRATDGKRLWSFQARGWVYGPAVATKKHVFFGSQDKTFYCLDKQTGKKVWRHKTRWRIESGGAVDDRFVYFGSCDGGLYCLNQSDGKARWRFATDKKDGHNSAIYSVPILHKGGVYFAAGEGHAYAINQHTGKLKWKLRPSKGSELYCSPATDGKLFFLVTRASLKGNGKPSLVAFRIK